MKQTKTVPEQVYAIACEDVGRARYQGIAAALAAVNRLHGEPTMVCDVMRDFGLTLADLKKAGADRYDLTEIRTCLMQGNKSDRAQVEPKAG